MSLTAIVPLKSLTAAKGRLAEALSPVERQAIAAWMAGRVLDACHGCAAISDILVVAGDETGARLARHRGAHAEVVAEPGLAAALAAADRFTAQQQATVVVAADLPELTAEDVQATVDAARAGDDPVVVIAPTRDGGTGALLRRPPHVIVPAYGPDSAAEHERRAREAGARVVTVHRPGLARDVDTPDELRAVLASPPGVDVVSPPR